MRRYSSGQRGETVNLLASAYEGSNPSRRTVTKTSSTFQVGRFLSVRREVQLSKESVARIRNPIERLWKRSEPKYRIGVLPM